MRSSNASDNPLPDDDDVSVDLDADFSDRSPDAVFTPNRRNFMKKLGLAGAAGGLTASAGCQQFLPGDDGNNDYIIGTSADASTLNFLQISDEESDYRVGLTMDSAYGVTSDHEVFPLWADINSDDKRVYEVELRDHLEWGAGYGEMTAEDWVYMINNVLQAEDNWAGYSNQGDWKRGGEFIPVEKTGKYTFEIQLPEVDPAFPLKPIVWGLYCFPKGLLEPYVEDKDNEGLQQDDEVQTLAYSGNLGPYNYDEWEREAQFVATRNEDYYMQDADDVPEAWQNAPNFDSWTYKVIPEQSSRLSALQTGEIHRSGVPADKVEQFQNRDDTYVNISPQPYITMLIYNQRANGWLPFRDQNVRRALSYAVDKQNIADNILRGHANVAHTFQPEFSDWYDDSEVEEFGVGDTYSYDTAQSNLEDALGDHPYHYDGDQLVDENGDQVTLDLVYVTGTSTTQTMAEFIQQEYSNIGINVSLTGVQNDTLLQQYVRNSPPEDEEPMWNGGPYNGGGRDQSTSSEPWDMLLGLRFNTYPRTPSSTRVFFERDSNINFYGYYPETDFSAKFDEASQETDEDARQDIYAEIYGEASAEQPWNFLNLGSDLYGYRSNVEGPTEEFAFRWNQTTFSFE